MAEAKAQINASTVLGSLLCGHVRGKDKVISKKGGAFVVEIEDRSVCGWWRGCNYRPYVLCQKHQETAVWTQMQGPKANQVQCIDL